VLSWGALWSALSGGPEPQGPLAGREFTNVVIDSRQAVNGSLFVALPGERQDGHDYVVDAFHRGATAALVAHPVAGHDLTWPVAGALPVEAPAGPVCLQVADSLAALQQVAAAWRQRLGALRVVGVTGSLGKTSTKDAIATVLAQRYCVLKNEGNLNNEIGLPLTLLRLTSEHEIAVLEMGMYARGEIARLVEMARPSVGVVTNVGPVHLERLGTIENIAAAKAELPQGLPADGVAVLNGDDQRVSAMAGLTPARKVIRYGLGPQNDLWADEVESRGLAGTKMRLYYQGESRVLHLVSPGRHNVYVALAAAAVGLAEGLSWDEIIQGLSAQGAVGRLRIRRGAGGSTLLDDAYNASPASMLADLDLLAEVDARRLAILGDMLELGEVEEGGHREVGRRAGEVLSVLVTVGRRARWIAEEALRRNPALVVRTYEDRNGVADWVRSQLQAGDCLLIKGSRGMALEEVVAALCEEQA